MAYFYHQHLTKHDRQVLLEEDAAKHIRTVLRMKEGEQLQLTNGTGLLAHATLSEISKKQCIASIISYEEEEKPTPSLHMAIGFTRNNSRNEWMLEKLTELGCASIIPLQTKHSVKTHFKTERFGNILISAMLQSRQTYLPVLSSLITFDELLLNYAHIPVKLIAHCEGSDNKMSLCYSNYHQDMIIAIGPEGDFSSVEIESALNHNYQAVTLGNRRLRTETATIAAAATIQMLRT